MFTQKTIEQAWVLYQASLKHSSPEKDYDKLIEEDNEFYAAVLDDASSLDDAVYSEFADKLHMLFRWLFRTYEPKSYDEAVEITKYAMEWFDDKYERQIGPDRWNLKESL